MKVPDRANLAPPIHERVAKTWLDGIRMLLQESSRTARPAFGIMTTAKMKRPDWTTPMLITDHTTPPVALGPYSPIRRAAGLIFVSAQVGIDQKTRKVPKGGFDAECQQAFDNLLQAVRSAGAEAADIVQTTVLYTDAADLAVINEIFTRVFPSTPPTRTVAMVALPGGMRVAVDGIAAARQQAGR